MSCVRTSGIARQFTRPSKTSRKTGDASKPVPGASGSVACAVAAPQCRRSGAEQRRRIHRDLGEPEPEAGDRLHREQMTGMGRAPLAAASRARRDSRGCAGIRRCRSSARCRTAARRDPCAGRRSAAGCAHRRAENRFSPVAIGNGGSLGDLAMKLEIERMDRLLDPGQRIGCQRFEIAERARRDRTCHCRRPRALMPGSSTPSTASIRLQIVGQRRRRRS